MGKLKSLTLPMGKADNRFTLDQKQVETLIKVYYDKDITQKNVSGYVYKQSLTHREHYLLTQLGLDVAYGDLVADQWTMKTDKATLFNEDSTTISIGGELSFDDVVLAIGDVTVESGDVTEAQVRRWISLDGNVLSFTKEASVIDFMAKVTLMAHPVWNTEDSKTVAVAVAEHFRTVWINPASASAQLQSEGNLTLLDDYVKRCKPYVFNAFGTKKAEIASATFVGGYSGMTSGAVTFADGTEISINELNNAGCNFMVLRPELHIVSGYDANGAETLKCTGIYAAGTGEKVFAKNYIGMFKGVVLNGVLKSQPNRIPTGNLTIAQFQQYAKAGGDEYGLWNYSSWCKENALHLAYFANTNYEYNVGVGRIGGDQNAYNRVRNIVTGFTLPLIGQGKCGKVATVDSTGNSVNCLSFFNVEGMGEQIWEFVIGFRHDGSVAYVWDANEWSETHAADRTFNLHITSASSTYIKKIIAGANFDMLPREVGATSATGMCDGHWVAPSGRLLLVGGDACNGSICGLSASRANGAFAGAAAAFGSRLAFSGEPATVAGSELLT